MKSAFITLLCALLVSTSIPVAASSQEITPQCVRNISWQGVKFLMNFCKHETALVRWDNERCLPGCLDVLRRHESVRLRKKIKLLHFEACSLNTCLRNLFPGRA